MTSLQKDQDLKRGDSNVVRPAFRGSNPLSTAEKSNQKTIKF